MFRRLASGLPADPVFPTDLAGLGYFINEEDEIRNIQDPDCYFKFFLTKNDRHNIMQREAMNEAIRNLIYDRLEALGLEKIRVPLGATKKEPHLPIFVSKDLEKKKRVVILFYEHQQDLGVFAYRIIGGPGGINQGSAINLVKYIQSQKTSADNSDAPGIILANMGQLRWWRRGKKALSQTSWYAIPLPSAVDEVPRFDEKDNVIPGNDSTQAHVNYIFNSVVQQMCDPKAKINVIGVSDGACQVSTFLDNEKNIKWGGRITAFAAVATYYHAYEILNNDFEEWYLNHGRAYLNNEEPKGVFIAGPEGRKRIPAHGCPVFSLGEPYYPEVLLPRGYEVIIDWFQEVAGEPNYSNPVFMRMDGGDSGDEEEDGPYKWSEAEPFPLDKTVLTVSGEENEGISLESKVEELAI